MNTENKPLIFITNDDSLHAKGIASLIEVAKHFGEVVVVAPAQPQSGMGHAITISKPLRLHRSHLFDGVEAYTCDGTPVDCVKLAIYEVLRRKPDLILSGINHGLNASTNVLYSGTMSATIEGAMERVSSIGFSYDDFDEDADFSASMYVAEKLIPKVLQNPLPLGVCLNVNIPKGPVAALKGIQVCKQAAASWDDQFDKRTDPHGKSYFWMTGNFGPQDVATDTDLHFMDQGYATIVPTHFDMTAHHVLSPLKQLFNEI